MYCPYCGNQVEDNAVSCLRCGAALGSLNKSTFSSKFSQALMYLPLVTGIISLAFFWSSFFGTACAIISIVTSIIFRKKDGEDPAKKYHFTAGVVCAIVSLIIRAIILVAAVLLLILSEALFFDIFTHMF